MNKKVLSPLVVITILCVCLTALFITSCEKNNDNIKPINSNQLLTEGISIKEGALSFETVHSFFKTTELLGSMTPDERDAWESAIGFTSMRKELNTIFKNLSECESENEVSNIISKNSDLVVKQGEDVVPIIKSSIYPAICNREGIFYVDGVIHKVIVDQIVTSTDGKIETIKKSLKANKPATKDVKFIDLLNETTSKSGECGSEKTAWAQNSDRRCMLKISVEKTYCEGCCGNYYYQNNVHMRIYNEKKNWLGRWRGYQSTCYYEDIAYTVIAPVVTDFDGARSIFHYAPITNFIPMGQSSGQWENYNVWWSAGDKVQNSDINSPAFDRVKGKAKNSGMSLSTWAEINCGTW